MLRVLLAKDLRRAWRNPLPWFINLLVPLCMTALIGMAFGGKSDGGALGRIRFAIVDEDKSVLSDFLRGSANQSKAGEHFEPVYLDRETALREISKDNLSAAVIIPTNFMRNYLTGRAPVSLELIKNPAQSVHPAVMEELMGALVTGMNAVARNFQSEFPAWLAVFEGKEDYHKVSTLIESAGNKLGTIKKYINPPLVSYEKEEHSEAPKQAEATNGSANKGAAKKEPEFNIFAYLLAGMAGMFLLFLAGNGMLDLNRELKQHTFERYHTLQQQLLPFVAGKVIYAVVLLLFCTAIMLGGGALIFHIQWQQPMALMLLALGYACFAAGLMAVMVALVPDERRAGALITVAGMILGLAGGCAFPPKQLPEFMREHLTPLLPSYWFVDTVRNLQFGPEPWIIVVIKLFAISGVLIGLAAFLFRRRFKTGMRA